MLDLLSAGSIVPELRCDTTLLEVLENRQLRSVHISTGVDCLDHILQQVSPEPSSTPAAPSDILELVGETFSGKTHIAYSAAARLLASTLPQSGSPASGGADVRPHVVVLDCDGKFDAPALASLVLSAVKARVESIAPHASRSNGSSGSGSSGGAAAELERQVADCMTRCAVVHVYSTPGAVAAVEALGAHRPAHSPMLQTRVHGGGGASASAAAAAGGFPAMASPFPSVRPCPDPSSEHDPSFRPPNPNPSSSASAATPARSMSSGAAAAHPSASPLAQAPSQSPDPTASGLKAAGSDAGAAYSSAALTAASQAATAAAVAATVRGPVSLLIMDSLCAFYWQDKAWRSQAGANELYGRLGEALARLITRWKTRIILCRPLIYGLGGDAAAFNHGLRAPGPALAPLLLPLSPQSEDAAAQRRLPGPAGRGAASSSSTGGRRISSAAAAAAEEGSGAARLKERARSESRSEARPEERAGAPRLMQLQEVAGGGGLAVLTGGGPPDPCPPAPKSPHAPQSAASASGTMGGWAPSPPGFDVDAFANLTRTYAPFSFAKALHPHRVRSVLLTRLEPQAAALLEPRIATLDDQPSAAGSGGAGGAAVASAAGVGERARVSATPILARSLMVRAPTRVPATPGDAPALRVPATPGDAPAFTSTSAAGAGAGTGQAAGARGSSSGGGEGAVEGHAPHAPGSSGGPAAGGPLRREVAEALFWIVR